MSEMRIESLDASTGEETAGESGVCVRVKRTSARVLFGSADGLLTNKLRMTGTEREQHKYRWCF